MNRGLRARSLVKRFGGLVAVGGVDLDVPTGQVTGIVGPNGAGKTTFFNLLTGYLFPDGGTVWHGADEISLQGPSARAHRGIVRTFQEARIFERMTALENVLVYVGRAEGGVRGLLGRRWSSEGRGAIVERGRAALETVGLADLADQPAGTLPFGDQRLLSVARVVVTDAEVVLLDEPMAGLSDAELPRVTRLVRNLADEGRAVGLIDHNLNEVVGVCDRITVMHNGTVLTSGTPGEVIANDQVLRVYVGAV